MGSGEPSLAPPALIDLKEGESVPATFIRFSGGKLHYLKPGDEQNALLNPPRGSPPLRAANLETRTIDISKIRQLYWPPVYDSGLSTQTLTVSEDGKQFHHLFLIAEWIGPTPVSKIPVEVHFINLADPEQKPDRFKRGVPYAGGLLWSIGPDGATSMTLDQKILRRFTKPADAAGKDVYIAACPGYLRVIATPEGSEFVYDPKLAAFVHDARSAMPLTRASLRRLPKERVKLYDELTSRLLVPKANRTHTWTEVEGDDRVEFLNGYKNAGLPANKDIPPFRDLKNPINLQFITSSPMSSEEKWNYTAGISIEGQLAMGIRYLFYHDYLTKGLIAKGGRAFLWSDLSSDEQLVVHRFCELRRRKEEAAAAKGEKFAKLVIVGLTIVAAAGWTASEHDKKVREEAKTHTYKIGDPVRSFMHPSLGGWSGHVHFLGRDADEFEIMIDFAHLDSGFKKGGIRMRRGIDFRPN